MRTPLRLSLAGAVAGAFCLVAAPAALAQEAPAVCNYPFDCPEVIDGDTTDGSTPAQPAPDQPAPNQPAADADADAGVGGVTIVGSDTSAATGSPSTVRSGAVLPFTGGETLLIGVAGLGALVGGTAFVVAGRRRVASA